MTKEKKTKLQEYNKPTECLESLVGDLQRFKVSTDDAVGSLKSLVNYYSNLEGFCEKEKPYIGTLTYEMVESFDHQFDNQHTVAWLWEVLDGSINIDKLNSFIIDNYEEHTDKDGNKVEDEDIKGYIKKDELPKEVFWGDETKAALTDKIWRKNWRKKERQDPIENEPMCEVCHSGDVYSLSEDDEPYDGHCNECEEDRDLEICELDEKGKVK